MSIYVRPMTRQDLPAVTEIDREAFPTQWPAADYAYEFKNHMAHYFVACDSSVTVDVPPPKSGGFASWLRRLFRRDQVPIEKVTNHYIVGFVGFWIMAGESHITSIAVRLSYRRRGIGEKLLIAAIEQSVELKADFVTLEVRVSNTSAQALYYKLGFEHVGERKKYYLDRGTGGDTREDALIMTTKDIKTTEYQSQLQRVKDAGKIK